MGVYIKNMEMPTRCFACPMCEISDIEICCSIPIGGVAVSYEEIDEQIAIQDRPSWCPLVEVKPHGRLIDSDALEADTEWDDREDGYISYSKVAIECAPTIIESTIGQLNSDSVVNEAEEGETWD